MRGILASAAFAQAPALPSAVSGGQGEVAFQGYYLGGSQQDLFNTTGTAFRFQEFLPSIGLISGSVEGYGSQNRLQTGENFLELRGLPWIGRYWSFAGGDFRTAPALVESPFTNLYTPEIDARGVKIQAVHGDTQYSFFAGQETLAAGARVIYRIPSPQMVAGVSAVHKLAPHLLVGARVMRFSVSPRAMEENPYLFPAGRAIPFARTTSLQVLYTPLKRLTFYADGSRPWSTGGARNITSMLAGISWESTVLTIKANYASQGLFYFPLAGYFSGDRRGPYAEARLRPWKGLELFLSTSGYRNNLEGNPNVSALSSSDASAGAAISLPGKWSLTGQVSAVKFVDREPGRQDAVSNNRQITGGLARGIGHQTVQVNWREIVLDTPSGVQRQRSTEAGDTYQFHRFSLGGAVRYQQESGAERLNSLFFRGLAQVNAGPLTAYANVEVGNDLVNQTVFSTEAYRTSVVGVSLRLPGRWNLQTEMFRNRLNFALNEENIFLLQNGAALAGVSPAVADLGAFSQWSFFVRVSKQLRWGAGIPQESAAPGTAAVPAVKLTGSVEGIVFLKTMGQRAPAGSIPVSLDGSRTAVSGPDGHYLFDNVTEGSHEVGLALAELPADFDPGDSAKVRVIVGPRRLTRADFEVFPLSSASGHVTGPDGALLEDIVIRLLPGVRYTTTRKDGTFTFYNLREGDCQMTLDAKTLPEGAELKSSATVTVSVSAGTPAAPVEFRFESPVTAKPIRKVLDRK